MTVEHWPEPFLSTGDPREEGPMPPVHEDWPERVAMAEILAEAVRVFYVNGHNGLVVKFAVGEEGWDNILDMYGKHKFGPNDVSLPERFGLTIEFERVL